MIPKTRTIMRIAGRLRKVRSFGYRDFELVPVRNTLAVLAGLVGLVALVGLVGRQRGGNVAATGRPRGMGDMAVMWVMRERQGT